MNEADSMMLDDENLQIYPIESNLQPQKRGLDWLVEEPAKIRAIDFLAYSRVEDYLVKPIMQKFEFPQYYEFAPLNIRIGYREPSHMFVHMHSYEPLKKIWPSARSIWVDISQQFNQDLLDKINGGTKAMTIMTDEQKKMYEDNPKVFDALADELLEDLLGELSEKATEGLKEKLKQWLLVLLVRVNDAIEL